MSKTKQIRLQSGELSYSTILLFLIAIVPLMDSLNGLLNGGGNDGGLSVGVLYRLIVIGFSLLIIMRMGITVYKLVYFFALLGFCIISVGLFEGVGSTYTMLLFRLILPMVIITAVDTCVDHRSMSIVSIEKVFGCWTILFPLSIIFPYILGIGFHTYGGDGAAGFKGLYYAQNDVGYVLAVLFVYAMFKLWKKIDLYNVVAVLLLLLTNFILGLKSNYLIIVVVFIAFLLNTKQLRKKLLSKIAITILILAGVFFILHQYQSDIQNIINRWHYFYYQNGGLSFWTSSRSDRVPSAFHWLLDRYGGLGILFGSGTGYTAHTIAGTINVVEMDFFDVFFQLGLFGTIFVYGFYIQRVIRYGERSVYKWMFYLSLVSSTLAGHVLESALSGMVFALVCSALYASYVADQLD
ncbi:O-antigen ligase family protein [Lactiplantibacillus plantarum]|uniref:hypothetical protein n=1 Tax=Lactiplantibacillus plantarum TaxID=1590 RepID=UPI0028FC1384|nr:hypothetical protein [Lactiplantibacillus plantarum]WNW17352.1 hypothetical protein RUO99_15110 [Lactiplantibacillus plantarum]WNW20323.1 hypothetical protein RUP00_15310 [Lactiplantibacillus plantarum]